MDKNYSFARVYPSLNISASLKSATEDFIVEEQVAIEFSGEGEHCWVYIEKREANTDWVAQQLANFCQVKKLAVSYAGLKDRHAVTSQWFSVQLPGKPTPDWSAFETFFSESGGTGSGSDESIRILQSVRHNRKLQRGALKSNKFTITLRHLKRVGNQGENEQSVNEHDLQRLEQRCEDIAQQGVPNYFGEQRFGRNLNNLDQAEKVFLKPRYKLENINAVFIYQHHDPGCLTVFCQNVSSRMCGINVCPVTSLCLMVNRHVLLMSQQVMQIQIFSQG